MRPLILLALLFTAIAPALARSHACTGAKDCRVCRNCKYCAYCSVRGHTCGVCAGKPAVKKHPPRKKITRKHAALLG